MRYQKYFLPIYVSASLLLIGCASSAPGTGQRIALDTLGAGVGGTAAYFGGDKDPALTTAGTVGGFVVSEAFQSMARSGREKAFNSGIEEGKAIGQEQILHGLWEQSNGLPGKSSNLRAYSSYDLILPQRNQNGVLYDMHAVTPQTMLPEKILIPSQANTNASYPAHYEIIQKAQ